MKRKVKATVVAALLGLVSLAASAAPLDSVTGTNLDWKLIGASSESSTYTTGPLGGETWSIGRLTSIEKGGLPVFTDGQGGDYLTYMLYGAVDQSQTTGGTYGNNIHQTGGVLGVGDGFIHLDIYRNSTLPPAILTALTANRTNFNTFTGITDLPGTSTTLGIPYLQMVLVPGYVTVDDPSTGLFDETQTTLFQNASALTLPASGDGNFYASIVGGTGQTQWDTNGYLGGAADFFAAFTLTPNAVLAGGFFGKLSDPMTGNAIPEPGSLALFGLALAAFGVIRRRDNKK